MKNIASVLAAGMALTALLGSCSHKEKSAADEGSAMKVDVATPITDSVTLHATYPAYLQSNSTVDVVGRVNGKILSVNFSTGDLVKKGQVLYTIESTTYRDAVQQAEAQLQTARSSYEYAAQHYAALKKALESDAVSQMEVAQGESTMRQAQASISSAEAALRTARNSLSYCTVTAPVTGHITGTLLNAGAYCGGEGAPVKLATIYEDDVLNVIFSIEDSRFINMLNDSVHELVMDYRHIPVTFSDQLPHSYTADMSAFAPDIQRSTGTMTVEAKIKNTWGELRDGMYATVSLPYSFRQKALLIKDASIGTDQLGKYVYLVNDSDKVVYTPIKIGELVNDSLRIVTDGLTPDSRYVTRALLKVRDGMKVQPVIK